MKNNVENNVRKNVQNKWKKQIITLTLFIIALVVVLPSAASADSAAAATQGKSAAAATQGKSAAAATQGKSAATATQGKSPAAATQGKSAAAATQAKSGLASAPAKSAPAAPARSASTSRGEGENPPAGPTVAVGSWADLQNAINSAADGTVITVEGDLEAQGADRILVSGKKVTVDLKGHTLNRQRDSKDKNGHVFEVVDHSEITIKSSEGNGTLTGGWANNGGGINIQEESVCNLENIIITGNRADEHGGGVCAYGTFNMTGGAVTGNQGTDCGGVYTTGTINLTKVTIEENTATEYGGAGINNKESATATITDCEIKNNAAAGNGGGIYTEGRLIVSGGKISANTATGGGGIQAESGEASLSNVTISGNTAQSIGGGINAHECALTMDNCTLSANTSKENGGGIYSYESTVTINGGQIASNSSQQEGGGLRIYGGTMSVTGASITENETKGWGGGIYVNNDDGVLNLDGTIIEKNKAYETGGGIFFGNANDPASVNLTGRVIVQNNGATDVYITDGKVLNITGTLTEESSIGIVMESDEGTFTSGLKEHSDGHDPDTYFTPVTGYTVLADGKGEGRIAASEWPQLQLQIDRAENGSIITLEKDWTATESDQPLLIREGKEITLDLNGHVIDRNRKHPNPDGQVITVKGNLTIQDTEPTGGGKITGGYAGYPEDESWSFGGGIKNYGTLTLKGGEITGNRSDDGAIFSDGKSVLNIEGGAITGNNDTGVRSEGTLNMSGGTIARNNKEEGGGGVDCYAGTFTMTGGKIESNTARSGAAIQMCGGTFTMKGGEITGNKASSHSGAISCMDYAGVTLNFFGGTISGNEAGISCGAVSLGKQTTVNIEGAPVINGNTAPSTANLQLSEGKVLNITGPLKEEARVDFTSDHAKDVLSSGLTTSGSADIAQKVFTYGGKNDLLEIREDGELYLKAQADIWVQDWDALQAAIDSANPGQTIALNGDVIAHSKERILIRDKTLTLDLCGYTLGRDRNDPEYDSNGQILEIAGATNLTIKDSAGNGMIQGGDTGDTDRFSGRGGAISIEQESACTITGCTIRDSKAGIAGGAVYVAGALSMDGTTVIFNTSDGEGGGIYCAEGGTVNLNNTIISDNSADDCGGIYNASGTVILNKVTIQKNQATGKGGAGLNNKGTAILTDCAVSGNSCGDHGAGIFNDGPLTFTGGSITDNSGQAGAGIFNNSSDMILDGLTISGNKSSDYGGGIYAWDGGVDIRNCTIKENTCAKGGGGIMARCGVKVTDSMIASNTAKESGGAMYIFNESSIVSNVRMIENKAEAGFGGAIFIDDEGSLDLSGTAEAMAAGRGTSITGNKAEQGGGGLLVGTKTKALNISGAITIQNNESPGGNNAHLYADRKLTLTGALTQGTKIGVSLNEKVTDVSPAFTAGFTQFHPDGDPEAFFTCEPGYAIQKTKEGEACIVASEWPLLQEMIDRAKDGESISLTKDYKAVASEGALQVSGKHLTIDLNGHTIDRNRQENQDGGEVLHVSSDAELSITDSAGGGSITGGKGSSGGGIVNEGTLNFQGGSITGCQAANGGGGIFSTGVLNIAGGRISGNKTTEDAGCGGGIYSDNTLNITGGEISGNEAGSSGGGVYFNSGNLTMNGGIISGNNVKTGNGGGIFSYYGTLDIGGGQISGNSASDSGAGIVSYTALNMHGGSLTGNVAGKDGGGAWLQGSAQIADCDVSENEAAGSGGGLLVTGGTTRINSGTFAKNRAAADGGAVCVRDGGVLELFGGTLQDNEAESRGGAILCTPDDSIPEGTLHVQGAPVVKGNLASAGRNILLGAGRPMTIIGKLADEAKLDVATQDTAQPLTRGYKASGSSMEVFSYNEESGATLAERDGELYLDIRADVWVSDWKALQNAINAAENQGKVIAMNNDIGAGDEDRLLLDGKNVTVDLCGHTLDRQRDDSDRDGHVFELIGGSTLTVRDSAGTGVITGGWANNGGAINIAGDATCNIEGGTITGNRAEDDGGGIYVYGTLNMTGGVVKGNESDENGGGIYMDEESNPKADLKNVIIAGNQSDDCGGLYIYGTANLDNVRIEENSTREQGGAGINNKGNATLLNCTVRANTAPDNGPGIYSAGPLNITGGLIAENTGHAGAGLFADSGDVTLNGVTITGNSSDDMGGGIYINGGCTLTGSDCRITGNHAAVDGGGLYTRGTTSLSGGTINSNKAEKSGGAVRIYGGTASFTGVTMTDNEVLEGHGGGIFFNNGGTCNLSDTTISSNRAKQNAGGFFMGPEAEAVNLSGKVIIEKNEGKGNVFLTSDRKLTLTGALTKGSAIGVTMETGEVETAFTKDYYTYLQNADPSVYFLSDDDFRVCLLSGEAVMRADADQETAFIDKNSDIKDYGQLNATNWMAGISGERYLNEINMPGTHDSSMANPSGRGATLRDLGEVFAQTQVRYIDDQLNDGIRCLDLRLINDYCKHDYIVYTDFDDDGKNLWTCHGKTSMGTYYAQDHDGDLQSLDEVLGWVKTFLQKHPSETLVISFAPETNDDETHAKVMARLKKILRKVSYETNPSTGRPYIYMEDGVFGKQYTHYPKLKDCRGQFLIQADTQDTEIIGGSSIEMFGTVQTYRRDGSYKENASEIIASVNRFYGQYGGRPLPATADEHHNYVYSIGTNGTGQDDNPLGIPTPPLEIVLDIINAFFGDGDLFDQRGAYVGWVNQDGENDSSTELLWRSNFFDGLQYCTVTVDPGFATDSYPARSFRLLKNTQIRLPECIYANPNTDGNYFEGWKAGDTTYLADQSYKITGDVTFTAQWGKDMHTPLQAVWYDADDADKLRAETLQVKVRGETNPVTLKADDGWKTMLEGDVDQVTPVWPERIIPSSDAPQGLDKAGEYRYEVEGNLGTGFTILLYHTPEQTISASGTIAWDDADNKEGMRPDSVTLRLFADGKEKADKTVTAADNWAWDFGSLPKYKDGREVAYTLSEDPIDGYLDEINGFQVTNTHTTDSRHVFVAGQILWENDENVEKYRPESVKLHLMKDGQEMAVKEIKPDQDGYWFWSFFVSVPKDEDITAAAFTVTQDAVPRYSTTYRNDETYGYPVVVNTYVAHKHQPAEPVIENIVDPTCEGEGSFDRVVYCSTCHEELSRETVKKPALGHKWGQWTVTKEATETQTGLETRVCQNDKTHVQERTIPKVDHVHQLEAVAAKDATCTKAGHIAYWICTKGENCCYRYFADEEAAKEINEEDVVVEALGHDWDEGEVTTKPGCTSPGVKTYTCQREGCGAMREEQMDPLGHKKGEWEEKVLLQPTCTTEGYCWRTIHCATCGALLQWEGKKIPVLEHDWKPATCTEPKTCKRCQTTEGDPLGHDWKAATCTEPKTCKRCQATDGDPLGHDWKAATCTEPKTCKRCQTTEGDPLGHDWKAATCTEPKICKRCQTTDGDPLGHDWGEWEIVIKPTDMKEGLQQRICRRDASHMEEEILPETGVQPPLAVMRTVGNHGLFIQWKEYKGADGYDLFFGKCSPMNKTNVCKLVASFESGEPLQWTRTGLKKGVAYKAVVRAYVMKDGQKKYLKKSFMMHAYTGGHTLLFTNARNLKVKKTNLRLRIGKKYKIKAKVVKLKKTRKLMPGTHVAKLRYYTSNAAVATVSRYGNILARSEGDCTIYVFAHNGMYKAIKVNVK